MLTEIYALDASNATITGTENAEEYQNKLREISKSGTYKSFVTEKLMPCRNCFVLDGNLYTGSILWAYYRL
jgi:hydroxymethylglutaryl-CoA synthase